MRALALALVIAAAAPAAHADERPDDSVAVAIAGLINEARVGVQYRRELLIHVSSGERRRVRSLGVVGGVGASFIGGSHDGPPMPTHQGATGWLGVRGTLGFVRGPGEGGVFVQAAAAATVADELRRAGLATRAGVAGRYRHVCGSFGIGFEWMRYDAGAMGDQVNGFAPGVEISIGAAF